jgi:hypothetical protein
MLDLIMRSEAHFAALLFADLRSSALMQERFVGIISKQAKCDAGTFVDVFVEPAPFRDGWKLLDETKRRSLINNLLRAIESDKEAGQFEWMLDSRQKLRSPFTWKNSKLAEAQDLRRLSFIFRARPDLLVLTTKIAAWVELKVESITPAVRPDEYSQRETQIDIATFAPLIVDALKNFEPLNLLIQPRSSQEPHVVTWRDVVLPDLPHWNFARLFPSSNHTI